MLLPHRFFPAYNAPKPVFCLGSVCRTATPSNDYWTLICLLGLSIFNVSHAYDVVDFVKCPSSVSALHDSNLLLFELCYISETRVWHFLYLQLQCTTSNVTGTAKALSYEEFLRTYKEKEANRQSHFVQKRKCTSLQEHVRVSIVALSWISPLRVM